MSLNSPTRRRTFRIPRAAWITLGVVVLIVAAIVGWQTRPKPVKDPYRLGAVEQGDITRSVSASGSLQALVTVDVGSQISGQVTKVLVDFNDEVKAGQTLAIIDPQTYQSRVAQGQADILAGQAAVRQAQATLDNAQADYNRKKTLVDQGWYAATTLDQATAALKTSRANVAAAAARVTQSRAALRSQDADLRRTTIVAPIDGIVVDRKVEPGNTVAASLQAPVLFTIAQDLSKVEVKISVDEADVGQLQEGQMVRFTVDAFPDDTYEGILTQVRKQPTTDQNVVSYTVIAEADNPRRKLLPGMTANADIIIDTKRNVTKVPAQALRWSPPAETTGGARQGGGAMVGGPGMGGGQQGGGNRQGGARQGAGARVVEQLGLDAKQQKAWEPIQAEMRQKMQAARSGATGNPAAMREAMTKVTGEAFAKLEPLLRPDQKTKLVALKATMAQGRGGRGGGGGLRAGTVYVLRDGKPTPIAVRSGATDGSFTEIVGPDLKPGDQVIVGGGPRPKAQLGGMGLPPGAPGGGGGVRVRM
ncbi:MAG: efflux RND transporter periplasmic adaptor subunit [Alphaproteobacteria bacterium]|nr:efflux RND transporter periplasmic adaptor subunit [Alphaproteobacteria bacterium]MBU1512872.1 efflux RND transporter periplasmic adaptor subunit [Alphaproteobacteria bacterium]MBU2096687.1 efflux RND transporter periplasmic adaptor subunit [Alphaproteobacteria bacterium]MBU2150570.1 efflux RND transporter periplasmic adaptor subunit [Alphaproteobacteria bacterium]MBU2308068.1 efflux RND transporter periplasmic adaptor subunit [Alphaproteobacteria bacterium]